MNRLISIGNHYNAKKPFENLFKDLVTVHSSDDLVNIKFRPSDVILFGGGADISPSLYKQKPSRYSGSGAILSSRDSLEKAAFKMAVDSKSSMLGICRGAQLVCALSGGSLYQHVNNHAGRDHDMTTNEGTVINVCSVHHQMMNPMGTKHELIAWATEKLSNVYLIENEVDAKAEVEPEVVFFNDYKALAIQYHPEFMVDSCEAVIYSRELVKQYLLEI